MPDLKIRQILESEYNILEDFLYHAIFLPPGVEPIPHEVIFDPEIFVYIDGFGAMDDYCVVAEQDEQIVAIAWVRIIPGYGHIDDKTPELAISVLPNLRGEGIGNKLMENLFDLLQINGYKQTSLSVQKNNPALRFYKHLGYKIIGEEKDYIDSDDYLMIKYL